MTITELSHRKVIVDKDTFSWGESENLLSLVPDSLKVDLVENDKVTFVSEDGSVLAMSKYKGGELKKLRKPRSLYGVPMKNLEGKDNIEQLYFIEDYLDPEIYLHVLTGDAGTGKNFVAALASFYDARKTKNGSKKVIYTRDPIELGRRLGFLPGSLEEKTDPYMRPIRDAVMSLNNYTFNCEFERLLREGILEVTPVQVLRGANLTAIGIFDECQNEDVLTIQSFITRFQTPGSKVILIGSFKQIDLEENRKNLQNSGLYHVLHGFRGWERYSHMHLVDNMRGELAREADLRLPFNFK